MNKLYATLCLLLASCMVVSASENGGYYECDSEILDTDNVCVFTLTDSAPAEWVTPAQPHDVDGYDTWLTWTRAMTDCNSKTEDYVARSGGTPWSTVQLYEYVMDPQTAGMNPHHYFLQYLEEGAMDLVCLSTDLEMEHCDVIREAAGAVGGVDRCNCWFDAYAAIYGECPVFDMPFTTCPNTVAPVVCAGLEAVDAANFCLVDCDVTDQTGGTGVGPPDVPSPPDMPTGPGGPPA